MTECTSQLHLHRSREVFSASTFVSKARQPSSWRNEETRGAFLPVFLTINHKRKPADPVWYSRAPLGKNKIGEFLTKAAKNAGLPENVTNYSVRKTYISRLMDAEIPLYYVAQRSGHKNSKSLDSYKTASDDHQRTPRCPCYWAAKRNLPSLQTMHRSIKQSKPCSTHSSREKTSKLLQARIPSLVFFAGSNISKIEDCTFNFSFNTAPCSSGESSARSKPRKRHIIISDDSDSD